MKAILPAIFCAAIIAVPGKAQVADADRKAMEVERQLTDAERISLLWGYMPVASRLGPAPTPPHIRPSAGYFPPIDRVGFPGLHETDASLGITNPKRSRVGDVATALPSGLALAASFNPQLAEISGAMIGGEARSKGFNVLLAGGVNLTRDWYGGRNFEYLGEDPLLAGVMAGYSIRGIQSQKVVSTAKHFVLNAQETLRHSIDARISEATLRESDLLAFEIALELGQPGAIMCAYNKLNSVHSCNNDWLLNKVLRKEWGYKGWVMSDWGATHGPEDINAGLDQESGAQLDAKVWFDRPLQEALQDGRVQKERLGVSVRRILRSVYAVGADAPLVQKSIDYVANGAIARRVAQGGIVLLKNDGILPLAASAKRILVVGRFANRGVWSGGGSSQVTPVGGAAVTVPFGGTPFLDISANQILMPSSPLLELRKQLPDATIEFDTGYSPEIAAARAARADMVVLFASQWQTESLDQPSLHLPEGQDGLIETVAAANRNVVVMLETGNPIVMPWLQKVRAVAQAWYSGQEGGAAIADVLTGKVNPSGRLPITFPASASQAPRAEVPGLGLPDDNSVHHSIDYVEGSDVGYRWYAAKGQTPLFPFGFGLSYTEFAHDGFRMKAGKTITAQLSVRNRGDRTGADVPQLYLVSRNGVPLRRLVAFDRVELNRGEARTVGLTVDQRILAEWKDNAWVVPKGIYEFAIGTSAANLGPRYRLKLPQRRLRP